MSIPFERLPFRVRPDLTPYLVHLTRNTKKRDGFSAFDNLDHILKTGVIWGSGKEGFVKGATKAACFMDVPFGCLKYVLNPIDANPVKPRYEPYGVFVTKKHAYDKGCRPVLYLSNAEVQTLRIPRRQLWRVVRLEVEAERWKSWLHEREWRCPGEFKVPQTVVGVMVRHASEATKLAELIREHPGDYKSKPRCILPLEVVCQGLEI